MIKHTFETFQELVERSFKIDVMGTLYGGWIGVIFGSNLCDVIYEWFLNFPKTKTSTSVEAIRGFCKMQAKLKGGH